MLFRSVSVPIVGDVLDEGAEETFTLQLSSALNATVADGVGLGTIVDDDGAPSMTISDVTVIEGAASATTTAAFTVTLAEASARAITVDYSTTDGTAQSGLDYASVAGTLDFAPGVLTRTIVVTVLGDGLYEGVSENFRVLLSNAVNATIGDPVGEALITDDDPLSSLSVSDVVISEGDAGTSEAIFIVSLSAPGGLGVSFDYATSDAGAVDGSDYTARSGSLTLNPGQVVDSIPVVEIGRAHV